MIKDEIDLDEEVKDRSASGEIDESSDKLSNKIAEDVLKEDEPKEVEIDTSKQKGKHPEEEDKKFENFQTLSEKIIDRSNRDSEFDWEGVKTKRDAKRWHKKYTPQFTDKMIDAIVMTYEQFD